MRILVTGANGYLGQGVVKSILDMGNDVIATDFSTHNIDDRAVRVECDLFAIENPYEYFEKPDVVLHMAWRDGFVHYSDSHINDISKHYAFLKKLIERNIKQIAVIGTMHEIGFYEGCINENTPCNPITPYGISKNALRKLVEVIAKENNVIMQWLRGYYIVGNTKFGSSVFSKLTLAEEEGKEYFPFTTGQNQYDFIDYQDFCEQIARTVSQNKINGIINICSGKPEKLADRMESFIKENNFNIKLKYGEFPDRPYDSKAVWADSKKIDSILKNN